ncbi:hypothetical protein HN51_051788, partial [Arachis hypogaea]
ICIVLHFENVTDLCLSSAVVMPLSSMFNLSFQESIDDNDDSDEGKDEDEKPCFSEIERSADFLDKEVAANGFRLIL